MSHKVTLELDISDQEASSGDAAPIVDALTRIARDAASAGFTVRLSTDEGPIGLALE
ncbi:hypothetical protein [Nocardia wallacei]|uniref:Uncharacterized protein n=1 Tax=Nocardia wallacei TaxID=480035 RepID=A0A7G1KTW6_9NOCA|nr:hypothetical protein [Nocardia wallacei]BCK58371.1 hypothetical protein NWFMUON74_61430 [Nocardia wallacei]